MALSKLPRRFMRHGRHRRPNDHANRLEFGLVDSIGSGPRIPGSFRARPEKDIEMDVKVIAARYTDRPKTDPAQRIFRIADHIIVGPEKQRAGRMYVGDQFRAVVIT